MFGMAENIYGSVDNMIMIEFLFHQSMIFTTNCFDGLEETYFCLISRVFWTVEKNNQCFGTVHGFSMLLIDMISFLCLRIDILHGRKIFFEDVKSAQHK